MSMSSCVVRASYTSSRTVCGREEKENIFYAFGDDNNEEKYIPCHLSCNFISELGESTCRFLVEWK